jgi:hypothetical protein
MNVSPHHQRPTRYPWPGRASALIVIVALLLILVIGYILVADPFADDGGDGAPAAMGVTTARTL